MAAKRKSVISYVGNGGLKERHVEMEVFGGRHFGWCVEMAVFGGRHFGCSVEMADLGSRHFDWHVEMAAQEAAILIVT